MKKILVFFATTTVFCLLYILLAYIFLPLSEKWLSDVYQIKKELIKNTKGKKSLS